MGVATACDPAADNLVFVVSSMLGHGVCRDPDADQS